MAGIRRHTVRMARIRKIRKEFSDRDQNLDSLAAPKAYDSPSILGSRSNLAVVDDWPDAIPITAAEVDVLDCFLGEMLDAFLQKRH